MRHVFLINPAAGKYDRTGEFTQTIRAACEGLDYEILVSRKEIEGKELRKVFFTTKEECQEFCSYLNKKEGVTGYDYDREGNLIAESTGEDNE